MTAVLSFFAGPLGRWLAISLMLAAFGGFCFVKGVEHDEAKEAAHQLAQAQANLKAMAAAAAKTQALQHTKDEALNAANERAKISEAAASAARATGDSLRRDLADSDRVSSASIASLRAYTTTLRAVFGECTKEVERLAGAAQGHASDALTLEQSWPK